MSAVAMFGQELASTDEWYSAASCQISTSNVRTGTYSLTDTGSGGTGTGAFPTLSEVWIQIPLYFSSLPGAVGNIFRFTATPGGSSVASVAVNSSNILTALAEGGTTQTGSTALSTGWNLLEVRYKAGSGSDAICEVRLNGSVEATSNDGTHTEDAQGFYLIFPSSHVMWADDIWVDNAGYPRDTTGTNNGGKVGLKRPNADSSVSGEDDLVGEDAGGVTYDNVIDDSDSTYATGDGTLEQLWELSSLSVDTLHAVQLGARMYRGSGGGTTHHLRSYISSAENSADLGLGTSVAYYTFVPTTQPTVGQLGTYEAGAAVDGARDIFVTEFWVMVLYTQSEGSAGPQQLNRMLISMLSLGMMGLGLLRLIAENPEVSRRTLIGLPEGRRHGSNKD